MSKQYKKYLSGFLFICGLCPFLAAQKVPDSQDEYIAVSEIVDKTKNVREDVKKLSEPKLALSEQKAIKEEIKALEAKTDELARAYPQSDKVQNAAANEALQSRDWQRSLTYGNRAVELATSHQDPASLLAALKTRGTALWFSGDYPSAAEDAKRALALNPQDHAAMALWQFSKGRIKGAPPSNDGSTTSNDKAKKLDSILDQLSMLNLPEVKAAAQTATDHGQALKYLEQARRLQSVGDFARALEATNAAAKSDARIADIYMERAIIFAALKDITQALAEVQRAIKLWTERGQKRPLGPAYALSSDLRNQSGDTTGAMSDADQSLGFDPTYATAYRFRAQARERLGHQAEQILADYKKSAELDPEQASYYSDAVTRLGGQKRLPNPDTSRSRNTYAGGALLLLLIVAVWSISRRRLNPGAASAAMTAAAPAELGGQYEIGEKIGEGGMGAVYKGWDKLLKRPVAIKRLIAEMQENPRDRERFIREAETVASLHHPNIVEIYTIIRKSEQETYLVFEYLVGDTVHQLLDKSPGHFIAPARALEILRPMAEAVDYAHSRGVIHRDLKPANVMIADNGWVKVMDFGIARQAVDSRLTMAQTIAGTPSYMAPEQAMGAAVKESDIYALGCTLYEMLTGALPFQGSDPARDKIEGLFTPPSKRQELLPKTIDAVLAKTLLPRSQDRYHSGRELYQAAAAALGVIS